MQVYNPSTGLEYLRARYYNANMGRFFQEDTYLGDVRDPLTLNRYAYGKNSPENYVDPSGYVPQGYGDYLNFEELYWKEINNYWEGLKQFFNPKKPFNDYKDKLGRDMNQALALIKIADCGEIIANLKSLTPQQWKDFYAGYQTTNSIIDEATSIDRLVAKRDGTYTGDEGREIFLEGSKDVEDMFWYNVGEQVASISYAIHIMTILISASGGVPTSAPQQVTAVTPDGSKVQLQVNEVVYANEKLSIITEINAQNNGKEDKEDEGESDSWERNLKDTSELNSSDFDNLTDKGTVKVNQAGSDRPPTNDPNSFLRTENGEHVFVYDNNGDLIYDISSSRVKGFKINTNPAGKKFLSPYKLDGPVPQFILDLFGW